MNLAGEKTKFKRIKDFVFVGWIQESRFACIFDIFTNFAQIFQVRRIRRMIFMSLMQLG